MSASRTSAAGLDQSGGLSGLGRSKLGIETFDIGQRAGLNAFNAHLAPPVPTPSRDERLDRFIADTLAGTVAKMDYRDLVAARKQCRRCMLSDPGMLRKGAEYAFDPPVVSHWAQWLGDKNPQLLVTGQDFANVQYFEAYRAQDDPKNKTNDNLKHLLSLAGFRVGEPPIPDSTAGVYLANAILCMKAGKMNAKTAEPLKPKLTFSVRRARASRKVRRRTFSTGESCFPKFSLRISLPASSKAARSSSFERSSSVIRFAKSDPSKLCSAAEKLSEFICPDQLPTKWARNYIHNVQTFVGAPEVQELMQLRDERRQLIKLIRGLKTESRGLRRRARPCFTFG